MKYNVTRIDSKIYEESVYEPIGFRKALNADIFKFDMSHTNLKDTYIEILDKYPDIVDHMLKPVINSGMIEGYLNNTNCYIHFNICDSEIICTVYYDGSMSPQKNFAFAYALDTDKLHIILTKIVHMGWDNIELKSLSYHLLDLSRNGLNYMILNIDINSFRKKSIYMSIMKSLLVTIALFLCNNLTTQKALFEKEIRYINTIKRSVSSSKEPVKNRVSVNKDKKNIVHLGKNVIVYTNDTKQYKQQRNPISCSFNVSGHWRTYRNKDGSVRKKTWVDTYLKGKGKPFKNKIYTTEEE